MTYLLKKLLNSLKCPICNTSVDIINYNIRTRQDYNYGCAANNDHYLILIKNNDLDIPCVLTETINVYDVSHKYQLTKRYQNLSVKTEILIFNIDAERRVIFNFKNNILTFDKELFNFSKFNMGKIIDKIKTILMFY